MLPRVPFLSLCLLCCAWGAGVLAATDMDLPSAVAEGRLSPETWSKVAQGLVRDLLVEFHDPDLDDTVRGELTRRRLRVEDDAILALRRDAYSRLKQRVVTGLQQGDVEVRRDFSHLPLGHLRVRDAAALRRLLDQPGVAAVYESRRAQPLGAEQNLIGQPQASQVLGQTGAGTTVAVLDTGVTYTGSAFGNCTAPGVPAATCKVVAATDTATDDGALDNNGHGTAVAATVLTVASGTKIAAVDVYDHTLPGATDVTIAAGINWAIANKSAYNIVAINVSMGGGSGYSDPCSAGNPLNTPVSLARSYGILTVMASGNNGYPNGINWPACTPLVVSVGAVYSADTTGCTPGLKDTVACFSNVSDYLSLLTPAGATSFAAPLVAGATAMLAAAYPLETPADWAYRMTATGKPVADNRSAGLGYVIPRLDIPAALLFPASDPPANDAFAAATPLASDTGTTLAWNHHASVESGEPSHAGDAGGHSVWWQWTPGISGTATLDTHGSNFDTLLAVHTGDAVDDLAAVAGNDNDGYTGGGGVSGLSFHADAGTTYRIAVDGKSGAMGDLYLKRAFTADTPTTANLSITLGDTPDPVPAGSTLTYILTVANSGPATASNVVVTQTLPAPTGFISAGPGCDHTAGTVTCVLGSLAAGTQASREVQVMANLAGTLLSQAQVSTSGTDGNPLDDNATEDTTVIEGGVTPGGGGDGDVPMPAWAMALLGAGLLAVMRRHG